MPLPRPLPSKPEIHYVVRGLYVRPMLPRDGKALICVACSSRAHSPGRIDRLVATLATLQVWREDIVKCLGPTELDSLILRLLSAAAVVECVEAVHPREVSGRIGDSTMFAQRNWWALGGAGRIEATAGALLRDVAFRPAGCRIGAAIERATMLERRAAARYGFAHFPGQYDCGCRDALLPKTTPREPTETATDAVVNLPDPWRIPGRRPAKVGPIAIPGAPQPFVEVVGPDGFYVPPEVAAAHQRICRPAERAMQLLVERRRLRAAVLELALLHRAVRRGRILRKLSIQVGTVTFERRTW